MELGSEAAALGRRPRRTMGASAVRTGCARRRSSAASQEQGSWKKASMKAWNRARTCGGGEGKAG